MPGTIRAFLAIEVSDEIRQEMQTVQDQFRQARPQVKWIAPEQTHLTLKFLGLVDREQLLQVSAACQALAAEHLPFYLTFQSLGCFPNVRNLRVLWMGTSEGEAELMQLQQSIESQVAPLGFPEESRAFQPHLTLGRIKEPLNRAQMLFFSELIEGYAGFHFGTVPVTAFHLIRSVLQPAGPVHTILESYQLGLTVLGPGHSELAGTESQWETDQGEEMVTLEDQIPGVDDFETEPESSFLTSPEAGDLPT